MALSSILRIYRARLRVRMVLVQELLAVVGLAIGVSLLFATQVASTSLNRSIAELSSQLVGNMQFQLQARSPRGFDAELLRAVRRVRGVAEALPVLEEQADVIGPRGRESVELLGSDPRFAHSGGPLLRHFSTEQLAHQQSLALPAPVAKEIGAQSLLPIEIQVGTHVTSTLLGATLQEGDIGKLVDSPVAIAPVAYAERLAGTEGRVTRIFVRTEPGAKSRVRKALVRLAAGRLNVVPANFDTAEFAKAAAPTNQAAGLFSGISALVGFLLAFNAMLITAQTRREMIGELRRHGATRWMTVSTLLFDAFVLGVLGAAVGLVCGDVLSIALFHAKPGYLSYAFPVGSQRVVTWQSIAIAALAGLLAASVGVLVPLRGELSRPLQDRSTPEPTDEAGEQRRRHGLLIAGGLACLAATTAIIVLDPAAALVGSGTLTIALLMLLAPVLDALIGLLERRSRTLRSVAMRLAIIELRTPATRSRSLAIAATGAIAVFGSVAILGSRGNLQAGLDHTARDMNRVSAIWVSATGEENTLGTTPFTPGARSRLQGLRGVRSVALYRGGFLDIGSRLAWVIAPPSGSPELLPSSQLLAGNLSVANARLRAGGWIAISQAIASERHLRIGQAVVLPTPSPMSLRIAAFTTNVGWPPGAIIMSSADYAQAWGTSEASAYNIDVGPGVTRAAVAEEIRAALGSHSGLSVQTAHQRELSWRTSSRQGLSRLSQIGELMLIAAVLAIAGAMAAMVWQRRTQFAYLKRQGYRRGVLWRALLWESGLLLLTSCVIGAVFGLYGQLLGSHSLAHVTGFPVVYSLGVPVAIRTVGFVTLAAVAIVAIPGYIVTRVSASVHPG